MADTIADKILSLAFVADQKSTKDTLAQIAQLRASLNTITSQQKALSLSTDGIGNSYAKMSAKAVQARNEFLKGTTAVKEQISVLERLRQAQNRVDAGGGGGGGTNASDVRLIGKGLKLANTVSNVIEPIPGLGQASTVLKQAAPLVEGLGASVAELAVAAPIAAVAVAGLAVAIKVFSDNIQAAKERQDAAIKAQEDARQLEQTATKEEIQARIAAIKQHQAGTQASINDQVAAAQAQRDNIPIFGAGVVAFGGLAQEIIKNKQEVEADQFQIEALTRALNSNKVAANEATAARAAEADKIQQLAKDQFTIAQNAANAQIQIQQQANQQEANILQRAADQRVAIAQRAADAEADALLGLNRSIEADRIRLGQQQADARLAFQRDEAKSAKQHFANLQKIRKDAEANEFELILNRDFAGLAKARRDTEQRLEEEDTRYKQEREQRLIALKNQLGDQQKAFIRERQARLVQYQQQLQDLHTRLERELRDNDAAARLDLERLHAKTEEELKIKQAGYVAAIEMAKNYAQSLVALFTPGGNPLGASGNGTGSGIPSSGAPFMASGGWLSAGKTAVVSDAGRESFTSGGRTAWLPNAKGYFTPMQGGQVNPAGGGGVNINLSVTGSDYKAIRRKVHADLDMKLSEAFEALAS